MSRNLTYLDCHATVTRKGEIEPCGREVVGWLSDTEAAVGDYYPVCIHHLHQSFMAERVPLRELLAQAWDEGKQAGLRQSDWEHGDTATVYVATNPYRAGGES